MQITFIGPNGESITVSDPRCEPGKEPNVARWEARRPTSWLPISWKIITMKV
jgi:hypothetical protein